MSSRRDDDVAPLRIHESPHDAAAMLCAFLMARRGWSPSRIALTLGIPPLVLEECIRNGVSSAALRSQLALWIAENNEESLPSSLVKEVVEAASSSSAGALEYQQDDGSFSALDPVTQSYFVELELSVGQSFISILNDPHDVAETTSNWGFWLGSVMSGALDRNAQTKHSETAVSLGPSSFSSLSSETLLARYDLQEDYSSYLQLVTAPYNSNREEGRQAPVMTDTNARLDLANISLSTENLPWPSGVPKEFFGSAYDSDGEVCLLERNLRKLRGDCKVEDEIDASVNAQTFGDDFELMESRMKKLRQWESEVERCLLKHVQSRSEQFFAASHEFRDRAAEAKETLEGLRQTRAGIGAFGEGLVREMLMVARCYRSRNNLGSLCNLAEMVVTVSSQIIAIENWVALPERDMMELPVIVDVFYTVQEALLTEHGNGTSSRGIAAVEAGWITKVSALKAVPRRVLHVKEKLCMIIVEELETILLPAQRVVVDDSHINRTFISVHRMGIWHTAIRQCRDVLTDALWMTVRETFIAFIMSNCKLSDSEANNLLSTAVSADASREEKLFFLKHSNTCRFAVYMQLIGLISDHVIDFVTQAGQRWGLLLVEVAPASSAASAEKVSVEDTRHYFSSLCAAAESIIALLLEVRSHDGKTPTNARDLEGLVSMGCAFLPNIVSNLQGVLAICGNIGDPWGFVSGKRIKSAVTRLAKEHLRVHHAESIEKLRVTIENETWLPEVVDPAFQFSVDTLCRSDDTAIEELRARAVFTEVMGENGVRHPMAPTITRKATATTAVTGVVAALGPSASSSKPLETCDTCAKKLILLPTVDGRTEGRVVSRSLLMLIELLHECDDYLGRFPFLAFDVMGKMYDLFTLYDSRSAALLLGAMAVENGVLQTITTQNMAVASQNLAFLCDGIPLMQKRWLRAATVDKLSPAIVEDIKRVRKDCATHRCELFGRISDVVKDKIDGLGTVSEKQWKMSGNEWVMAMLRETARLMRAMKPLLPVEDCRGVVVPLLGTFARMIRSVTMSPAVDTDLRAVMLSDVLLFKANVERFGFDVLRCAMLFNSEAEAMTASVEPSASEADVVAWFFSDERGQ
ncbi:hypothetical protein TraAM80_06428 [Trypanosoma rangeli]|uniref:Vacuolar protein sorting-associated protein 54 C-terminal domain-containing protein n=1 Tax=Trypanosoma rangeli TaxID=5698 RepID=A0A3R7N8Z7_TRYRA|nr:uncharacterized protein TraAM80_06428 [Trypanosoma rangeli]RNF02395.1 hypothetical protein TraAM80_06428 [Trypanosoma rangeli]|eukprot:RNF02395.1 hypothetical protein TraAM80_06428 [Trypanosoma rangeli]